MFKIYGFTNSFTRRFIYIGQTVQPLPARLAQARYEWTKNKDGKRKHMAITGVYAMGGKLGIVELQRVPTQEQADTQEKWWIDLYNKLGYRLGNTSAGGPGNVGVRRGMAQRNRIAKGVKAYYRRKRLITNLIQSSNILPLQTAKPSKNPG
jgi:hypothetical protein